KSRATPEVGRSSPSISRTAVVLPAPFGPSSDVTCPGASARSTPSRALTLPNSFVTLRSSATGASTALALLAAVFIETTFIATSLSPALPPHARDRRLRRGDHPTSGPRGPVQSVSKRR